jgi:hypothetical protein
VKIKKKVTDKVIAANRANAQKSTGPNNTAAVGANATKHGLLARHMKFQNEEEELEFNRLRDSLYEEYLPCGATRVILVEEAANSAWKMRMANRWEMQELENRSNAAEAFVRAVDKNYYDQPIPLFRNEDGSGSAAQLGWAYEELVIESGSRKCEQEYGYGPSDRDCKDKAGEVSIKAKLGSGLDMVLRYQAAIKKDFYRAISALKKAASDKSEE